MRHASAESVEPPGEWLHGQRDGAHDKQSGHSFRPTQMDNYKNADRGFLDDMGDRDQYKLWYREGYSGGYKNGWDTSTRR